jgi:hypothetical protein
MTSPPAYRPPKDGPTLLWWFQAYIVKEELSPEAAAAWLTEEINTGKLDVPGLKPGWRLEPVEGERRPKLIVDKDAGTKTASKTEFSYGPPRLDVVDADGNRTSAAELYARQCSPLPLLPPKPSPALKKQSRQKTVYQTPQGRRANAVLQRMFKHRDYPAETEIAWVDLWEEFCGEYERYAKDSPSGLPRPAERTVRRQLGWE